MLNKLSFSNDAPSSALSTLSLHDALPICAFAGWADGCVHSREQQLFDCRSNLRQSPTQRRSPDRKSTRLNSSHSQISYAVFCLKKKTPQTTCLLAPTPLLSAVRRRRALRQ